MALPTRDDLYPVDAAWRKDWPNLTDEQIAGIFQITAWPARVRMLRTVPEHRRSNVLALLEQHGVYMCEGVPAELDVGAGI